MNQAIGRVCVLPDPPALARHVAEWLTAAASAANGSFRILLSGGSTPKKLYSLLASSEIRSEFPWQSVEWYWGDERVVPYDHPESNYRMVREAMFDKVAVAPETIHPIPTDGSPEDAAWRYERTLQRAYGAAVLDPESPHSSTLLSWLVALTVIQPRRCRKSPYSKNADAGSLLFRTVDPRFGSPPLIQ